MMIDPETYYQHEIKGKTAEQILRKIAELKREIARLKRAMEHPNYVCGMCPSEKTQLRCTRMYLERAKRALEEVGSEYWPTAPERRVMDFDENIDNIDKITLEIGGFFSVGCVYTVQLGGAFQFWVDGMVSLFRRRADVKGRIYQ